MKERKWEDSIRRTKSEDARDCEKVVRQKDRGKAEKSREKKSNVDIGIGGKI